MGEGASSGAVRHFFVKLQVREGLLPDSAPRFGAAQGCWCALLVFHFFETADTRPCLQSSQKKLPPPGRQNQLWRGPAYRICMCVFEPLWL